jgi:hypothetical protein
MERTGLRTTASGRIASWIWSWVPFTNNLLVVMDLKPIVPLLLFVVVFASVARSQDPVAEQKLHARYSAEQIADMQVNAHHKYVGLLLYYASSFLVSDGAAYRAPTELEVAAVDLHQFDALRQAQESVVVFDPITGLYLKLLSRDQFEQVVLSHLDAPDRTSYLEHKSAQLGDAGLKQPVAR